MRNALLALMALIAVLLAGTAWTDSPLTASQKAALKAIARGETAEWPGISAEQSQYLYDQAEKHLAHYRRYHLPYNQHADIFWSDYDRTEAHVLEGVGDSACWTGHYLAALAFRHAVEPAPELVDQMVVILDTLLLLAKVSGREGYIARFAGEASDPAYQAYYSVYGKGEDPDRPGLGKRAFRGVPPWEDLVWLGWSSRDTYDGVQFGLAMAWHYVDEAAVRDRVREMVTLVGRRLRLDGFNIPDGKGNVTMGLNTFRLPWMLLIRMTTPEDAGDLWVRYGLNYWRKRSSGFELRDAWTKTYFPNNLNVVRFATLCKLEPMEGRRKAYQRMFRRAYREDAATHLNAHFAAMYLLCTDAQDTAAAATLQGMLLDFPEEKWARKVDHSGRPDIEMRKEGFAENALFVSERPMTDFFWQRAPTIVEGSADAPLEFPALDMFLPYWAGRLAGAIPPPGEASQP